MLSASINVCSLLRMCRTPSGRMRRPRNRDEWHEGLRRGLLRAQLPPPKRLIRNKLATPDNTTGRPCHCLREHNGADCTMDARRVPLCKRANHSCR